MKHSPTLKVVDLLRETLVRVEKTPDSRPDDPAMKKLKWNVVRLLAELEVAKASGATYDGAPLQQQDDNESTLTAA